MFKAVVILITIGLASGWSIFGSSDSGEVSDSAANPLFNIILCIKLRADLELTQHTLASLRTTLAILLTIPLLPPAIKQEYQDQIQEQVNQINALTLKIGENCAQNASTNEPQETTTTPEETPTTEETTTPEITTGMNTDPDYYYYG